MLSYECCLELHERHSHDWFIDLVAELNSPLLLDYSTWMLTVASYILYCVYPPASSQGFFVRSGAGTTGLRAFLTFSSQSGVIVSWWCKWKEPKERDYFQSRTCNMLFYFIFIFFKPRVWSPWSVASAFLIRRCLLLVVQSSTFIKKKTTEKSVECVLLLGNWSMDIMTLFRRRQDTECEALCPLMFSQRLQFDYI